MIKEKKAIKILKEYEGKNPYIKKLAIYLKRDGKINLTQFQTDYVIKNKDFEPKKVDKVVEITEYLGESLRDSNQLTFTPKKILINYIVGQTDKVFHIYGKLKQNQNKGDLYFVPKTQLIDNPLYVDKDIEVDFDKYQKLDTFELKDGTIGRSLYEHQKEGVKFLLKNDGCIMADDMGLGKANSIETKVFTPKGETTMGELKVGDYVIGSDGNKTKVMGVYPQPIKELYRVTFNDGFSTLCCKEHIWTVTSKESNGEWVDLTVEQMLNDKLTIISNKSNIYETFYKDLNGENRWRIPIVKPIQFENNYELPTEPYLFGYSLNTSNDIKLPEIYKYASIDDRISLLQGLTDSDVNLITIGDGEIEKVEYTSNDVDFLNIITEVTHSLGGISKTNDDGQLTIIFSNGIIPYKDIKKHNTTNEYTTEENTRYIKDISFEKLGKSVCINVEAEDSLYVIEHGIVTHNTLQSIVAAIESGSNNILIVCPSAVKINWEREIQYFQEMNTSIISGRKWKQAKFTIINFDILKNFHQLPDKNIKAKDILPHLQTLISARFDLCIIDEAHKLKNKDSKRGEIMREVCKYIPRVWLLTGTPVANRPMDLYNLLKLIKSPLTTNFKHFATRYCEGKMITSKHRNKDGSPKKVMITNGASNLNELASKIKNVYIRRLKTELKDMPNKIITPNYYGLNKNQLLEYQLLWDNYLEERIEQGKKGVPDREMVELGLLRKFVAMEMIPNTLEVAKDAIENGSKIIIFTNFTDELLELHDKLPGSVTHYGKMSDVEKQNSIDRFQNDPKCKVFIGNIISAGVGITLTASDFVIFNSFDWVPGNNEQGEDRSYRIGQENNVNVVYQLFSNSVSEIMWKTLNKKKDIIDKILGVNGIDEEKVIQDEMDKILTEIMNEIIENYE